MQFLDSITFPYDDATRRHVLTLFQHKASLLDGEIVQEHLLNQPLLCVVLLVFVVLSLGTFLFSIVFTACRALGNCGAKRYQAHPTNGRRYSLYLPLLIVSWVGMAGATIHLLTSGASYWQQGADDVQNGADRAYPLRAISKRQAQERNVFELFEDSDYDGDFEKVGDTSSRSQPFVIAQPKSPRNLSTDTKNALKNHLFKIRNLSDFTTPGPQKTDTFVFELTPSKTSNDDTNSIADQPFQLIRPSARADKQRHFVKAIHGPFVWDTFSDGRGRNVHRHDSTTKVMAPLTGTPIGDSSMLHSGDELVTPEELSNEILLDLKDPEKEDVIAAPISTSNATSDSTSVLAANNTVEQEGAEMLTTAESSSTKDEQQPTTIPSVETSTQKEQQRALSSQSRELQDLLELSDEASIMIANEWPSVKEELLNMTSSELFNISSTSTSEETTTSPPEEIATTEISTAMDIEFPTTESATSSATEDMTTTDTEETAASTEEPTTEMSTTEPTTTEDPTTEISTTEQLTTKEATTELSTTEATTMEESSTEAPSTEATTVEEPATTAAVTNSSTTTSEATTTITTTASSTSTFPFFRAMPPFFSRNHNSGRRRELARQSSGSEEENHRPAPFDREDDIRLSSSAEAVPATEVRRAPAVLKVAGATSYSPLDRKTIRRKPLAEMASSKDAGFRSLHLATSSWAVRISIIFIATVMVLLVLPIPALIIAGTVCYLRSYHPMDRTSFSEKVGQLCVVLAVVLLFFVPFLYLYLSVVLLYNHLYHTVCPALLVLKQHRAFSMDDISFLRSASEWASRECGNNLRPIEGMWFSCLAFAFFSLPSVFALFKLSKYYLRMKAEYYWNACEAYGVIRPKVATMNDAIYGNIYGTLNVSRSTNHAPPKAKESPIYGVFVEQPIYTAFRRS